MLVATAQIWALFFHLVGVFLLVAGLAVAGVAFEAARRRRSPAEVALLLGLTRIGVLLVAVSSRSGAMTRVTSCVRCSTTG